ncbi:MAG: acetylglutamate/LysW-gamma-L-alpha-aminoadipate kinase [Planctomycetota bacterium]|jgi:acetylglutamate/LysW-gamma-L-alpha-aminoadipate kinase
MMNVIKIGGAAGIGIEDVVRERAQRHQAGEHFVLVHGGSDAATRLGEELGHPARFATSPSGHTSRLTDARTLEIFIMATALENRRIVSALRAAGVSAVGLSGLDGGLIEAERKQALRVVEAGRVRVVRDDLSGRPTRANGALLESLLAAGHVPVIAPVGGTKEGQALNIDGDRAAAVIASALRATNLMLLTAVPGVLREFPDESTRIDHVALSEIGDLLELAAGRMKKKVLGAREALDAGVRRVIIAAATGESPIQSALSGNGTVIGEPCLREVQA